jgi:hypothetical protein
MCIVSLTPQLIMNVTIDNQCSIIELTSPAYYTKDNTCYIHLPQQVDSESKMKVNFKTGLDRSQFGGILLYRLQGKDRTLLKLLYPQRKEDTSKSCRLLVIWGWNSYKLYLHVRLIEHESALVWDKDKLKTFYDEYDSQYNIDFISEEWLLDDNIKLETKCGTSRRGLEMNINIRKKDYLNNPKKPLWIDSKR